MLDVVRPDARTVFLDREHLKGYDEVPVLPKPFGFTEYGPHGPRNPPDNYDYLRFIGGLEKRPCRIEMQSVRVQRASRGNGGGVVATHWTRRP